LRFAVSNLARRLKADRIKTMKAEFGFPPVIEEGRKNREEGRKQY
jgi:hypothetical protein